MDNNKNSNDNYWNKIRDFRLSRTPFWIGFGVTSLAIIAPIIVVWILLSADFANKSFNFYEQLPTPQTGYLALIVLLGFLIWSLMIVSIFFFTKLIKADLYTYTIAFWLTGVMLILNASWMQQWAANESIKIFLRFLFCLVGAAIGSIFGVILTTFARNYRFKIEEEDYEILKAYRNGQEVPNRKMLRFKKAEEDAAKREKNLQDLEDFKATLDQKLLENYDNLEIKQKEKKDKLKAKLDAKEKKQRDKHNKNKHN
ncbi:hypothetical protein ESOMN_v1c03210 [Williamsoniiplasma somnilux]|uniref:Transmembrane protein n=1 Tax=Williamsoniiplasma somnilux TaxID=215578 RepID=A0A2K8P1C3_9MOLU|nr:hypothetical protein [Williamsoniiplasma somnilux]ATZ18703.1 hypothetical protein ESOMN_v1c03210 [Williamsoniiplasma somnilux]